MKISRSLNRGRLPRVITREMLDTFFVIHGVDVLANAGHATTIKVERFTSGEPITAGGGLTYTMTHDGVEILSWYPDGRVTLRTGGYRSEAQRRRMNLALVPLGWKLCQNAWRWYLWPIGTEDDGADVPFRNGMVVTPARNSTEHNK